MLQSYTDILVLVAEYNRHIDDKDEHIKPLWWDEYGVPRFAPHHPSYCTDIYADEVVLLRISCQSCGKEFDVQMSSSASGHLMHRVKAYALVEREFGVKLDRPKVAVEAPMLASQVANRVIHYGDPPHHDCHVGETMNVWDLRVIEFWRRHDNYMRSWARVPELEIELPDAKDPDRG